jgi:hypothetical protein
MCAAAAIGWLAGWLAECLQKLMLATHLATLSTTTEHQDRHGESIIWEASLVKSTPRGALYHSTSVIPV